MNAAINDANRAARRRSITIIAVVAVVLGLAYAAYRFFVMRNIEYTDNAYVEGHVVQITPQIGGTVLQVLADETQQVQAGTPLVKLDPADAQAAYDQAKAALAQTERDVRGLYANNATLQAQVALRRADLTRAQADLARAQTDVDRRAPLVASGAVGKEEYDHVVAQLNAAKAAVAAAQSGLNAAQEQLATNETQTQGTTVEQHPSVLRAKAKLEEAQLALQRTTLYAPVSGVIAKRAVQIGQRVAAGSPLMTMVALDQVWVDANFKEAQLKNLRIGQPATLHADVYGSDITYHGRVEGLGAGTGAAFSLLPAQNATGNWIKIVQRVPVRIALDPAELKAHPLRVGLSMEVDVDTTQNTGTALTDSSPLQPTEARAAPAEDSPLDGTQLAAAAPSLRASNPAAGHPAPKATAAHAVHARRQLHAAPSAHPAVTAARLN